MRRGLDAAPPRHGGSHSAVGREASRTGAPGFQKGSPSDDPLAGPRVDAGRGRCRGYGYVRQGRLTDILLRQAPFPGV